ncbi:CREB-regulated transcription coactivator [Ooceraea biroi]|uniref:CREB-regulated transcription coactivator n=1 Tax=Ooceraea biroi TaxID=2015173 RepID=A0A026WA28_OOCBI|nr:CREB-regulated transcription coactivator [Ooceraea biroi]
MVYRSDNRSRSIGVGPMRSRPMEKRHDTSPYSGVPYLSPPPPDTWRRTNSDSALHQSANEACQSTSAIPHRRGSDACRFFFFSLFLIYETRLDCTYRTPYVSDPRFLEKLRKRRRWRDSSRDLA